MQGCDILQLVQSLHKLSHAAYVTTTNCLVLITSFSYSLFFPSETKSSHSKNGFYASVSSRFNSQSLRLLQWDLELRSSNYPYELAPLTTYRVKQPGSCLVHRPCAGERDPDKLSIIMQEHTPTYHVQHN